MDRIDYGQVEASHIARRRDWHTRLPRTACVPIPDRMGKDDARGICFASSLTIRILIATEHSSVQTLAEFHLRFGANR
jgi:hypothetical protein